jgi:hypothetical protein
MKRSILFFVIAGLLIIILFVWFIWNANRQRTEIIPATAPQTTAPLVEQKVYFIAVDNGGEAGELVGCNDSLVPIDRWVSSEGDIKRNTVDDLFMQHEQTYQRSGLHNPLWQSSLSVQALELKDGMATLTLQGTLKLDSHCDGLRAQSMIQAVLQQFEGVQSVNILINKQSFGEIIP